MSVRDVGSSVLGWALLLAIPGAPVALLWWVATRYPGWPVADLVVSLGALSWCYWLTSRLQSHLDRLEAVERRSEELRAAVWADWPDDDQQQPEESHTAPIPVQQPDTEPAAAVLLGKAFDEDEPTPTVVREIGGYQFTFRGSE